MRLPFLAVTAFAAAACGGAEFKSAADRGGAAGAGGASGASGVDGAAGSNAGAGGAGTIDAGNSGGTNVTDGSPGVGGSGAVRNSGDCEGSSDCSGLLCVELVAGGYRVCAVPVPEATSCSTPGGACCKSSDCRSGNPKGTCVLGPDPRNCGGPVTVPSNVCVADECQSANDCSGGNATCAPPGTLGNKAARCFPGGCVFDRDCRDAAGGICAPVLDSCCNAVAGLYCVYPSGCRRDGDCRSGQHCAIQNDRTACVAGVVTCPLSR